MNVKVKGTSGITLDGNKMSGNTYPVKDWIKKYLCGKWDNNSKSWVVDLKQVETWTGTCIQIDNSQSQQVAKRSTGHNGWCNRCHSYCYGDCTAN